MIWIISGPSSSGKTTFIAGERAAELTGQPPSTPVVWASSSMLADELNQSNVFLHYNMLRPLQQLRRGARRAGGESEQLGGRAAEFGQDPQWQEILEHDAPKKAIVLVAGRHTLIERVRQRSAIGEPNPEHVEERPYRSHLWLALLEQVDLLGLYRAWLQELRDHDIPYVLVDSTDDAYTVVDDEDRLAAIVNDEPRADGSPAMRAATADREASPYSREEIVRLVLDGRFGYHRVELPYGMHSRGQDRSETRDLVLPPSLAGKTVLDVGCAIGYFSFEAEARGAERVVGVDVREIRMNDALLLKDIKQSRVEFMLRDIVLDPLDEAFDYVLLLNVVHHLHEPVRAIRQLAAITKERLVIEFPTLADPKFGETLDAELPPKHGELPLIGVSSMRHGIGQTFVFSPAAMHRILTDHDEMFANVHIVDSPMPGRAIAFADKDGSLPKPSLAPARERPVDTERRKTRQRDGGRERRRRRGLDRR